LTIRPLPFITNDYTVKRKNSFIFLYILSLTSKNIPSIDSSPKYTLDCTFHSAGPPPRMWPEPNSAPYTFFQESAPSELKSTSRYSNDPVFYMKNEGS